jgi:hypothetical protein
LIFIHDTRDKVHRHDNVEDYLTSRGHEIVRSKLYVGDISLLANQSVCIDLKGLGLKEVYSNLVQQHERFRRECQRAQEAHIKLIVLVEEDEVTSVDGVEFWANPRITQYANLVMAHAHGKLLSKKLPSKPPISSKRLMNMMKVMAAKYGVEWRFCKKKDAGSVVEEILGGGDLG